MFSPLGTFPFEIRLKDESREQYIKRNEIIYGTALHNRPLIARLLFHHSMRQ